MCTAARNPTLHQPSNATLPTTTRGTILRAHRTGKGQFVDVSMVDAILATWGLAIVVGQLVTLIFGRGVQFVPAPVSGTTAVFGENYSGYRLLHIPVAILIVLALNLTTLLWAQWNTLIQLALLSSPRGVSKYM